MAAITHFYWVPKETTDQEVDKTFTQEFMHVHFENGTMLIRKMKYAGDKLDPSGQTMADILDIVKEDHELKQAIQDFLNDV